jgi:hypothetical protein
MFPKAFPTVCATALPVVQAISLPSGDQAQLLGSKKLARGCELPSSDRRNSVSPIT